jgi:hypothetical protein
MNTPKTAIFLPTKPLDLLLDFVNVKTWNREELRRLQTTYSMATTIGGQARGYDDNVMLRGVKGVFLIVDNPDSLWINAPKVQDEDFFLALENLQNEWRERLIQTQERGPNIEFLRQASAGVQWRVIEAENPFAPRVGPFNFQPGPLDEFLEIRFLDAALTQGDDLKRLRICENPACRKMYLYNRPIQKYCDTTCKDSFHNKIKIESGYLARHQAIGRIEKPDTYRKHY